MWVEAATLFVGEVVFVAEFNFEGNEVGSVAEFNFEGGYRGPVNAESVMPSFTSDSEKREIARKAAEQSRRQVELDQRTRDLQIRGGELDTQLMAQWDTRKIRVGRHLAHLSVNSDTFPFQGEEEHELSH